MTSRIAPYLTALILIAVLVLPGRAAARPYGDARYPYVLIDLGTLGGPASYFPNGFDGFLNNQGTAAGWADTATPDPYPGFCFNPDCFVSHAFQWHKGVLTDLGTLPGGSSSQALSLFLFRANLQGSGPGISLAEWRDAGFGHVGWA